MITNIIVYNRPSLNVEYDYVGIIDGLSDEERHDFAITQDLTTILSTAGVQPVVVRVGKRLELLSALEWLTDRHIPENPCNSMGLKSLGGRGAMGAWGCETKPIPRGSPDPTPS